MTESPSAFLAAISAVIPARNEEQSIATAVRSLAAQPEIGEVIVVDDDSTDQTAAVLHEMEAKTEKLNVIPAAALPAGWIGKSYAAGLGAAAARSEFEWFLFSDADTLHLPGSAARALRDAEQQQAALVSYSPEQEMKTFWERALSPLVYCRLATRFSYQQINDPQSEAAAANGQYILIRKDAYQAIGGHACAARDILEDVSLARAAKHRGFKIYFAPGRGIARTRMYRSFRTLREGWAKNLYPLMGGSIRGVLRELLMTTPLVPLLFLALGWGRFLGSGAGDWILWTGLCWLAWQHIWYGRVLRRNLFSRDLIPYYMPGSLLYAAILCFSAWSNRRGVVTWKGRVYTAKAR